MTDTDYTVDLREAVLRLTHPYRDHKVITDDRPIVGTDKRVVASLQRDGLLKQLRAAIVGGIGSHEGSSPGRERIPFDTGAVDLYDSIEDGITRMFVNLLHAPVFLELEKTLDEWCRVFVDLYQKGRVTENTLRDATRLVERWGRSIEGHFDKPKQLEMTVNLYARDSAGAIVVELVDDKERPVVAKRVPAPCPVCGEAYAHNPRTGDKTFALLVEYREVGPDTMNTATGLCRFCETVWSAGSGMRELAYGLEVVEQKLNA